MADGKLNKADAATLLKVECQLDIACLVLYRKIAKQKAPKKAKATSWFGSFFGGSSEPPQEGVDVEAATAEVLSDVDSEDSYEVPTDHLYVNAVANLSVPRVFFKLISEENGEDYEMVSGETLGLNLEAKQRSAAEALAIGCNVQDIDLRLHSETGEYHRAIERPEDSKDIPILTANFENNPLPTAGSSLKIHNRLTLRQRPMEISVAKPNLDDLLEFFEVPQDVDLVELQTYVADTVADLKEQTRAGLEYAVDQRQVPFMSAMKLINITKGLGCRYRDGCTVVFACRSKPENEP